MGTDRKPQIILKTDQKQVILDLLPEGKFSARAIGLDEKRVMLEGDELRVKLKNGRFVVIHHPAATPLPPAPPQHYFPSDL